MVPEQRLTVEEALRAYTQGCAYAAFEEKDKGTISPGKLADVVVLSEDLFRIPPERIKDARVEITIVGGRVVYKPDCWGVPCGAFGDEPAARRTRDRVATRAAPYSQGWTSYF